MKTIYIELENPRRLMVAILIGDPRYYGCYTIYQIEHGRDLIDKIQESDQFEVIEKEDLPESLDGVYEWKRRDPNIYSDVVKGYIHKI